MARAARRAGGGGGEKKARSSVSPCFFRARRREGREGRSHSLSLSGDLAPSNPAREKGSVLPPAEANARDSAMHARDAKAWRTRLRPRETRETRVSELTDEADSSRRRRDALERISVLSALREDITHFLCKSANGKFLKHSVSINFRSLSFSLMVSVSRLRRVTSRGFRENSEALRACSVVRHSSRDAGRSRVWDREQGLRASDELDDIVYAERNVDNGRTDGISR